MTELYALSQQAGRTEIRLSPSTVSGGQPFETAAERKLGRNF